MPAARTNPIARLRVALTGAAAITAAASAQPGTLRYEGNPIYLEPVSHRQSHIVAHITVDHDECHDVYECDDPREVLLDALRCAGYDAWIEGHTVVVDRCHGDPHIRFSSREYRLTRHRHHDEICYTIRRRHSHPHYEEPVIIRDRYATPGIVFDVSIGDRGSRVGVGYNSGGIEFGGRFEDDDRYENDDRYERDDRNERPGNRDERDERPGDRDDRDERHERPGDRSPREHRGNDGVPSFETQRVERRDVRDQGVTFDVGRGFSDEPAPRRRP